MIHRAVVLDTNVIVSAGITLGGPPGTLVEWVLDGELMLFTCPTILNEYFEVLERPRFKKHLFPPVWLPTLLACATFRPYDPPAWPHPGPDADDLIFLSQAKQDRAVLITGNVADYPEAIRDGVTVVTPRTFLDEWTRAFLH